MMVEQSGTSLVDVESWRRWRDGADGARCWTRWSTTRSVLRGWTTAELVSPTGGPRTDAMQAALVHLAQDGEGSAATTLLVQLRPALIRLARWAAANGLRCTSDAPDEVRAVFFETVYRHPLQRRPAKIAANLVLDTRQRVTRSLMKSTLNEAAANGDDPGLHRVVARTTATDSLSELLAASTLRDAVGRLPGSQSSRNLTAILAYRAWILDEPRAAIAADLGLTTTTVSKRLHRLRALVHREDLVA